MNLQFGIARPGRDHRGAASANRFIQQDARRRQVIHERIQHAVAAPNTDVLEWRQLRLRILRRRLGIVYRTRRDIDARQVVGVDSQESAEWRIGLMNLHQRILAQDRYLRQVSRALYISGRHSGLIHQLAYRRRIVVRMLN